jgi:hypothetical protein
MTDPRLEATLAELAAHVEFPAAPDVSGAVRARLEGGEAATAPRRARRRLRPTLVLPVALVVLAFGGLAATPSARSTVLRWLGLEGVRIERAPTAPRAPASPPSPLGERTTLGRAARVVGFRPVIPLALGAPRGVYTHGQLLTLEYPGALLSEFVGRLRPDYIRKTAGPRTRIVPVTVGGQGGYWIAGAPHVVLFEDQSGRVHSSEPRLAGDTLVWRRGPLTLRLEARITQRRALAIARSIPPEGSTP